MENEVIKAISIHAHIIEASGFTKDKREYNALLNLLHNSVLFYERLGYDETMEFTKVLDKIRLGYRHFDNGIELIENSITGYYLTEIHSKIPPEPHN